MSSQRHMERLGSKGFVNVVDVNSIPKVNFPRKQFTSFLLLMFTECCCLLDRRNSRHFFKLGSQNSRMLLTFFRSEAKACNLAQMPHICPGSHATSIGPHIGISIDYHRGHFNKRKSIFGSNLKYACSDGGDTDSEG